MDYESMGYSPRLAKAHAYTSMHHADIIYQSKAFVWKKLPIMPLEKSSTIWVKSPPSKDYCPRAI